MKDYDEMTPSELEREYTALLVEWRHSKSVRAHAIEKEINKVAKAYKNNTGDDVREVIA